MAVFNYGTKVWIFNSLKSFFVKRKVWGEGGHLSFEIAPQILYLGRMSALGTCPFQQLCIASQCVPYDQTFSGKA